MQLAPTSSELITVDRATPDTLAQGPTGRDHVPAPPESATDSDGTEPTVSRVAGYTGLNGGKTVESRHFGGCATDSRPVRTLLLEQVAKREGGSDTSDGRQAARWLLSDGGLRDHPR